MVLRKLFTIDSGTNGRGPVLCAWQPEGTYLAIAGQNRRVSIVDRQGKTIHQIPLAGQGAPIALQWDHTGETLAILQAGSSAVVLWNVNTKKQENVDTNMKDITFMKWSLVGPQLAMGNSKGSIMLYNSETMKKMPIMGVHSKRISVGAWNRKNILVMSGEDRKVSFTDADGNSLDSISVKMEPTDVCFSDVRSESKNTNPRISLNMGGKSLILHTPKATEQPFELTLNPKYGNIVDYEWFGEGYLLFGTSTGDTLIVATQSDSMGGELSSMRSHRDSLAAVAYSKALRKGASIGDNSVRVFDMDDMKMSDQRSEKYDLDNEFSSLTSLHWTEDGQILCVASKNGNVYGFLTRIPVLSDAYQNYVLHLSSLREMSVRDVMSDTEVARIGLDIEPSQVSLGPGTAAIAMNNQVYYYRFTPGDPRSQSNVKRIGDRVYSSIVDQVKLTGQFASVLGEGKITLHLLSEENPSRPQRTFPEKENSKILVQGITENFLIFGCESGLLTVFSLNDYQVVTEFRHQCGIRSLSPNLHGTRIFFIDSSNAGYVFNPATEVLTVAERFNSATERVLWDPNDYGTIVGVEPSNFTTYVYFPNTRFGSNCEPVEKESGGQIITTTRPYGFNPVLAFRGNIICQMSTGSLATITLNTHKNIFFTNRPDTESFTNNIKLNRLAEAFLVTGSAEQMQQLAEQALHVLDIELAIRCYRQLGQPAMVMALERISNIHEKNMLLGHVALAFRNYNDAQNFFMRSSTPIAALEMRRDLMQWDQALQLAERMAPDQVPVLSKEYAQQLEFRNEIAHALQLLQRGRMEIDHHQRDPTAIKAAEEHNAACTAGIARCMLRTGNIQGGMQTAIGTRNQQLLLDCAAILEEMKQWEECAQLYARAEQYEKAATIYIKETKQLRPVENLLPKITSRNVLVMYAKAKEIGEGAYEEAEKAYAKAEDWDNVVRLKVEKLNDLTGAYPIVRRTRSAEAAAIVAAKCKKKGDIGPAVQFLLLAHKNSEAFELARSSNAMAAFEQALLSQAVLQDGVAPKNMQDEFALIAKYYDEVNQPELAGDYYHIAGNFTVALSKYLQVGTDEYIHKAIAVVGKARSDALTHKLIDFLMGEDGRQPKDPHYIFRLYMALKNWDKVARTAVIIATKEQELGNYREAHKILVDTSLALQQKGIRVSNDLRRCLMLVHSYLIVRHLVKPMDDHYNAAQMLLRVARNIPKFPKHIGQILTSCVIECQKEEIKASAYQYACMIVQNEAYRAELSDKHKKKIDGIVRKRGKEELTDPPEKNTPCPICDTPVAETSLECGHCQNTLPFCIVTGKHMVLDDWTQCPTCKFPALFTAFLKLTRESPSCPMCDSKVDPGKLTKVNNPDPKA